MLGDPGLSAGADGKSPPSKEEVLDRMRGQWKLAWTEREGERVDEDGTAVVTIEGDRWMFGKREVARIDIDPRTDPMVIDLQVKEDLAEADKGQTLEGIVRVEGDRLTCCFSRSRGWFDKQRPTEFSSKGNARLLVYQFERVKP
jgi:uncharacterized protein (TIGR03067 family)